MNYCIKHPLMIVCCLLGISSFAQQKNEWIHVYTTDQKVTSFEADEIDGIYFGSDLNHNLQIVTNNSYTTKFDFSRISACKYSKNLPLLSITTDEYISEVPDKVTYYSGTLNLEGFGEYPDVETTVNIRGRGNSTWNRPKKPYRLKFETKTKLCGLKKQKNYILLANYIDPTEIQNALAMKVAELLDMPYSNHIIPVNVVLNGTYKGSYMLTEKVGFNNGSIDDYDETKSILWELDTNYDEDFRFHSTNYNLPVMVKDPDVTDETFATWKKDFNDFENAVARSNSFADKIDMQSVVNWMIVQNICGNFELNHPKSVFMYKTEGGIYHLGPVWDFDWCFGYQQNSVYRLSTTSTIISSGSSSSVGSRFFKKLTQENTFMSLYKETWENFYNEKLPLLWEFFDEYAELIEPGVYRNNATWSQTETRDNALQRLREWLEARIAYINKSSNNYGLY